MVRHEFQTPMNAVDDLLEERYGIAACDDTNPEFIAAAQENGETPEEYVYWIIMKYGLTPVKI